VMDQKGHVLVRINCHNFPLETRDGAPFDIRAMQLTQVGCCGGHTHCLPPRRRLSGTGSMATACCARR
jgi:hypothetical protein